MNNRTLKTAVFANDISLTKQLLSDGTPIVSEDQLLIQAASSGYIAIVELLLTYHAAIDDLDFDLNSALHFAANAKIAKLLLAHKASVNAVNVYGETPFLMAAITNDVATLKVLLEHKASPYQHTLQDNTPLMLICNHGNLAAFNFFMDVLNNSSKSAIEKKAHLDFRNKKQFSALDLAIKPIQLKPLDEHKFIIKTLISSGAIPSPAILEDKQLCLDHKKLANFAKSYYESVEAFKAIKKTFVLGVFSKPKKDTALSGLEKTKKDPLYTPQVVANEVLAFLKPK